MRSPVGTAYLEVRVTISDINHRRCGMRCWISGMCPAYGVRLEIENSRAIKMPSLGDSGISKIGVRDAATAKSETGGAGPGTARSGQGPRACIQTRRETSRRETTFHRRTARKTVRRPGRYQSERRRSDRATARVWLSRRRQVFAELCVTSVVGTADRAATFAKRSLAKEGR